MTFYFSCSVISRQVLDHWNITRGQFGWDFIMVVMKSNCNRNKKKTLPWKTHFSSELLLSISVSQVIFFPMSLNGLNWLIIFNSASQSVEGGEESLPSDGNCCLLELLVFYWLLIEKNREWGNNHFGAAHSLWRCYVWPVTKKQWRLTGKTICPRGIQYKHRTRERNHSHITTMIGKASTDSSVGGWKESWRKGKVKGQKRDKG